MLLKFEKDFNVRVEYPWSNGLIYDKTYKSMVNIFNYNLYAHDLYVGNLSGAYENVNNLVDDEFRKFINSYSVTLDIYLSSLSMQSRFFTVKICYHMDTIFNFNLKYFSFLNLFP